MLRPYARRRVLVGESLNRRPFLGPLTKAEPQTWMQGDAPRYHPRGIDKIETVDRLNKIPQYIKHLDATTTRPGAGEFLSNEKQFVHWIKYDLLSSGKRISRVRQSNAETFARGQIVKLDGWDKRYCRAKDAILGVNRDAIDQAQAFAGEFRERARGEIEESDFGRDYEWRAGIMPEDHLVVLAVEGYDGSDFEVEIGVGNFIAWSEGIRRHIGRENGVVAVAAEVKSEDGDFRSSDVCLDLVNGLFAAERRRPGARNHIAGEGIQHAVGALDMKEA